VGPGPLLVPTEEITRGFRPWIFSADRLLPFFFGCARFSATGNSRAPGHRKVWKDRRCRNSSEARVSKRIRQPRRCDHASRAVADAGGVKAGLLIMRRRVAIVGQAVAPPLFSTPWSFLGQRARPVACAIGGWFPQSLEQTCFHKSPSLLNSRGSAGEFTLRSYCFPKFPVGWLGGGRRARSASSRRE